MTEEAHFKLDYQFPRVHIVINIDGDINEAENGVAWVRKMMKEMLEANKKH